MDPFLKLFTANYAGAFAVNLIACIVALIWTLGAERSSRDAVAWRGWIAFWIGTGAFYVLKLALYSNPSSWIPWVGLYAATWFLLTSFWQTSPTLSWSRQKVLWTASLIVVAGAAADIVTARYSSRSGWHQALSCYAIGIWAWRLRQVDVSKSIALLAYAVVQLPLSPLFSVLGIPESQTYDTFVASTYAIYAVMKITLIPPVYAAVTRRESP